MVSLIDKISASLLAKSILSSSMWVVNLFILREASFKPRWDGNIWVGSAFPSFGTQEFLILSLTLSSGTTFKDRTFLQIKCVLKFLKNCSLPLKLRWSRPLLSSLYVMFWWRISFLSFWWQNFTKCLFAMLTAWFFKCVPFSVITRYLENLISYGDIGATRPSAVSVSSVRRSCNAWHAYFIT